MYVYFYRLIYITNNVNYWHLRMKLLFQIELDNKNFRHNINLKLKILENLETEWLDQNFDCFTSKPLGCIFS